MLALHGFSINSLNTSSVYTFILGCNEFAVFPLKREYLFLRSIFINNPDQTEPVVMCEKDVLMLKFREQALKPFIVNLDDKSFSLVQNIL